MGDDPSVSGQTCAECGRPWLDAPERWRTYLNDDDEGVLYCPACAEREFGDEP